ncbi:T9SS type A sorting domain-containing protein [Marinirhabdus gelatinilytica]|uniref:Putative secreted protein (Por secretion system target) n=1 Tax=Marinirhabdus gelatinilytica TaxID=1703343 RepID=A0A370Q9Y8_9FLAO|nr:T9SS type A sorting domain-containing protein [Marinirhabdus gelatinilytica]RDK85184.1 putative secreted protein (Por secretion system target) [Marinirhabdus gelatinilytica]
MKTKLLILQFLLAPLFGFSQQYFGTSTYGDLGIDIVFSTAMDSNGTIFSTGLYQNTLTIGPDTITIAGGNADGYVAIHDNNGDPVGVLGFGGGFDDVVIDVAIDANDNLYLTGYFQGALAANPFDADPGPGVFPLLQPAPGLSRDIFVIKLDSNQEFVWAKQVSNPFGFGPINEDAQTIEVDSAGNVYIGGSFLLADFDPDPAVDNTIFSADSSTPDGFLLKLDTDGNFVWVKTYEGAGGIVEVEDIELDANEDILVTGRFRNQVDLDPGAGVDNYTTNGSDDIFVSKVDNDGNYIWGQVFGGSGLELANVITEIDSEIYVGGTVSGTVDLDPSVGDNTITTNGTSDAFYSKFDTDGNYLMSYVTGGEGNADLEDVYSIVQAPNGDLFISGSFIGTSDFDAGPGMASGTSNGVGDNFTVHQAADGSYKNHWFVGGSGSENNPHNVFNMAGELLAIGSFRDMVDMDPFAGEDIFTAVASIDSYVSRYFPFVVSNDQCAGAITVACGDVIAGETIFDTDSGGNPAPDEFFSYTGNGSLELVTVSLCNNTDYDSVIRIYDDCDLMNEIAMDNDACGLQSEVQFLSDGASTYYIMIEGNDMESGNFSMEITCQELPDNDFCSGALPITCGETLTGSTATATLDTSPVCTQDITAPGVWYVFEDTSGFTTDYTLSLCDGGTTYDSKLTVYSGDCGALVCEVDNDDACGLQSEVSFQGDGSTTYYILVHGFGTNTGDFSLNLECTLLPPPNDMIENSIDVDEIGFPYTDPGVVMQAATTEAGTPAGCDNAGVLGVWYNFVPTQGGTATALVTTPAGFTSVTFYTAPDENAVETDLALVDYFDNQCAPGADASIPVTAGQAYYVYVANTGGPTDIVIDGDFFLGTQDVTMNNFAMYPNPTTGTVTIETATTQPIDGVAIYTLLGQKVLQQTATQAKTTLDVSTLAAGTYLVQITVQGETSMRKLVKQ